MAAQIVTAAVKTIVRTVAKKLLSLGAKKAAQTAAGKAVSTAAGLTEAQISGLASGELNVLNIVRAKFVKSAAPTVARSLGMTTKELNQLIKDLKIKETYRAAVRGKQYVNNARRLVDNPSSYATHLGRNKILTQVEHQTSTAFDKVVENAASNELTMQEHAVIVALNNLQDSLNEKSHLLKLPTYLWYNPSALKLEYILDIIERVSEDMYYAVKGYEYAFVMVLDDLKGTAQKGAGGYQLAMEPEEYIEHITRLIENGYSTEPIGDMP